MPRVARHSPRDLVEKLRAQLHSRTASPKARGQLVRELRESLSLTSAELASRIGVSQQTVLRWEKGALTPSQVKKLELAIPATTTTERPFVIVDSRKTAIRPLEYVLERQKDAKRVWILKSSRPFLSGRSSTPRFDMVATARTRPNLQFNFVYPEHPEEARNSIRQFEDFLKNDNFEGVRHQFRGIRVTPAQASKLSLGFNECSIVIIEYAPEAFEELNRERDIFVELPVAVLLNPESNRTDSVGKMLLIELPGPNADELWFQIRGDLQSADNIIEFPKEPKHDTTKN